MGKRIDIDGPGDDPDEYWFECPDCEGTGWVSVPHPQDEGGNVEGTCPNCGGSGSYEGDADDVD